MERKNEESGNLKCHRRFDRCIGKECTLWLKVKDNYSMEFIECLACHSTGSREYSRSVTHWSWKKLSTVTNEEKYKESCQFCQGSGYTHERTFLYTSYDCADAIK